MFESFKKKNDAEPNQSRRGFLKGAAAITTGATAGFLGAETVTEAVQTYVEENRIAKEYQELIDTFSQGVENGNEYDIALARAFIDTSEREIADIESYLKEKGQPPAHKEGETPEEAAEVDALSQQSFRAGMSLKFIMEKRRLKDLKGFVEICKNALVKQPPQPVLSETNTMET